MVLRFAPWLLLLGCATTQGPALGRAYVADLQAGRYPEAYARLSPDQRARISLEEFQKRHLAAPVAQSWHSEDGALTVRADGASWTLEDVRLNPDPKATLQAFLKAVDARDFATVHSLLSSAWRAQYTPQSLAADFGQEPLSPQRVDAVREALNTQPVFTARGAELPLKVGAVLLVLEKDAYRIASLE